MFTFAKIFKRRLGNNAHTHRLHDSSLLPGVKISLATIEKRLDFISSEFQDLPQNSQPKMFLKP